MEKPLLSLTDLPQSIQENILSYCDVSWLPSVTLMLLNLGRRPREPL